MSRAAAEPGLLDTLRRVAATVASLVESRIELASIELTEARNRAVGMLAAAVVAAVLVVGALLSLSAWIAVAFWDRLGGHVLGLLTLVYLVIAGGLAWWLAGRLRAAPAPLAETLRELRQDARALRGEAPAARPPL